MLKLFKYPFISQAETEKYCREMRYRRFMKYGADIRFLKLHTAFHPLFIILLKITRLAARQKLRIVSDKRKQTKRPIIYAPVHIGGDDIQMIFEAIKKPCWLLMGDPREIYRNIDGMALQMNGLICFDTDHKPDRKLAKARIKALLRQGGSIMMFPEGAWSVLPEKPVMHLFAGAVEAAICCDAEIVPVGILRKGRTYYVCLGKNITYTHANISQKNELTEKLRDILATQQWKLVERFCPAKRSDPNLTLQNFYSEIDENNKISYHIFDALATRFIPKGQTDYTEAFVHLKRIEPTEKNSFLFNKNYR